MTTTVFSASRRRFFRRIQERGDSFVRPPWALAESEFIERCDRCTHCIDACPERILVSGSGGYPEADYGRGGCTLCGECAAACPTAALNTEAGHAWAHRAHIKADCLSMKGIVCRACGEACDPEAIRFRLQTGGRALPLVNLNECTGCGACRYACPVNAISLTIPDEGHVPCPA